MYYLKLDISGIFIKKIPVSIVVREAVIYCRKSHNFSKIDLFLEITYQYKISGCQKKITLMPSIISHGTYHETIVCLLKKGEIPQNWFRV